MGSGADDLTPMGYTKDAWEVPRGPANETIETPTMHGEQPHVVHAEGSRAIVVGCTETAVTVVSGEEVALARMFAAVLENVPERTIDGGPNRLQLMELARWTRDAAEELGVVTRRRVGPDVETMARPDATGSIYRGPCEHEDGWCTGAGRATCGNTCDGYSPKDEED